MGAVRNYKKGVVENRNLVFISIIITLCFKLVFFFYNVPSTANIQAEQHSLLNSAITQYLSGGILSFTLGLLASVLTVLYLSYLNTKHKLIRTQTFLIYLFPILLLGPFSSLTYINPEYIALLLTLMAIDQLMDSYLLPKASFKAYNIGFLVALASLLSIQCLLYIPVFWIGFKYMRILNIKTILASILGIVTVYWLLFSYLFWQNDIPSFQAYINQIQPQLSIDITKISIEQILLFGISIILLATMIVNYSFVSFYDKIQTRANLSICFLLCSFSLIFLFITSNNPTLNLLIMVTSGSLLLSHFFSLTDQKWKIYLFYIFILFYIILSLFFVANQVELKS